MGLVARGYLLHYLSTYKLSKDLHERVNHWGGFPSACETSRLILVCIVSLAEYNIKKKNKGSHH